MRVWPAARKSNFWEPEAKFQASWAAVLVRGTTPLLAKVSMPSTSDEVSEPCCTPESSTDSTVAVTVLDASRSVKVSVPEPARAALVSVRLAVRASPEATVIVGASLAPVMVTTTSRVVVAAPSAMETR